MIDPARMYCAPTECCVQPDAVHQRRGALAAGVLRPRLRDLQELLGRHPAYPLHHLRRVAGVVPLEDLVHAARVLQRRVGRDVAGTALDRRAARTVLIRRGVFLASRRATGFVDS